MVKKVGRPAMTKAERKRRTQTVKRLRKRGLSSQQIANKSGLSIWVVKMIITQLQQDGEVRPYPVGRRPDKGKPVRQKIIIRMKRNGATQAKVGAALGVTRQRVQKLCKEIKCTYGKDVFAFHRPQWKISEAAAILKVSAGIIVGLCRKKEIPCKRLPSSYVIGEAGMKALQRHPRITGKRICIACQRVFAYTPGKYKGFLVCSEKCVKKARRKCRQKLIKSELNLNSLHGWYKRLYERLAAYNPPSAEKFLTLSQAAKTFGLSQTQMWWLGTRGIITTGQHLIKRWRGQSVITYAASELKIAGEVYRASLKRKK